MPRELISVHLGHSGARIGDAAWALALREHGLGSDGLDAPPPDGAAGVQLGASPESRRVLFDATAAGKHVPRCLFVDMEARVSLLLRFTPALTWHHCTDCFIAA